MRAVFIDTETTGLETEKITLAERGLVQVSAEVCDLDPLGMAHPLEVFSAKVRPFPGDRLSTEALEMHKVTREQLEAYEAPESVHDRLENFLARYCDKFNKRDKMIFAAYNAPFDADVLRSWFKKCGDQYYGSWFWTPPVDVMALSASRLVFHRPRLENFKLATVAQYCGLEVVTEELHTADYDRRAVRYLWNWCMATPSPVLATAQPKVIAIEVQQELKLEGAANVGG